ELPLRQRSASHLRSRIGCASREDRNPVALGRRAVAGSGRARPLAADHRGTLRYRGRRAIVGDTSYVLPPSLLTSGANSTTTQRSAREDFPWRRPTASWWC